MVASGITGTTLLSYERAAYDLSSFGDQQIRVGRNSVGDTNSMTSNGYVQIGASDSSDYYTLSGDLDAQCFGCSISTLEDYFVCAGSSGSANAGYQAFMRAGSGANTWTEYANNIDRGLIETWYNNINPGSPITIAPTAEIGQAVRLYFDENDGGAIKAYVTFSDGTDYYVGHAFTTEPAPGVVEWEFDSFTPAQPNPNFGRYLANKGDADDGLYVAEYDDGAGFTEMNIDRFVKNGADLDLESLVASYEFSDTVEPTKMTGLIDGTVAVSHKEGALVSWGDTAASGYVEAEIRFDADDGADEYDVSADFYQVAGGAVASTASFKVSYADVYTGVGQESFDLGYTYTTSQDIGIIGGGALSAFNIDQTDLNEPIVPRSVSQPAGSALVNIAYDPKDIGAALLTPLTIGVGENDVLVEVVPTVSPIVTTTMDPTMGTTTMGPTPDDLAQILQYWNIVLGREGC
jgi:hypothetical protein